MLARIAAATAVTLCHLTYLKQPHPDNYLNDRRGYTCVGITPAVGLERRRRELSWCDYSGAPELLVKSCFDRNPALFKKSAEHVRIKILSRREILMFEMQIYRNKYFYACQHLSNPAFYACADISARSDAATAQRALLSLGAFSGVSFCVEMTSQTLSHRMQKTTHFD